MFENRTGITLVALVITIIVLLILAGVSISLVVGENGIMGKAGRAADETAVADARSALELAIDACQSEYYDAKYVGNVSELKNGQVLSDISTFFSKAAIENNLTGYTISGNLELNKTKENSGTVTLTKTGSSSKTFEVEYTSNGDGGFVITGCTAAK